jgi:HAD superfamily phosphoserine phosphatase-like hydrolase
MRQDKKGDSMNIIFDLDSTLATIEGIDELGIMKNLQDRIKPLTHLAMSGQISFGESFQKRLSILKPSMKELNHLGQLYLENITPYAREVVASLKLHHRIFLVTGAIDHCALPISQSLGINHVYTNKVIFSNNGEYSELDKTIPLWRNRGKTEVLEWIKKSYPEKTMMIGDGYTDLEAGADLFVCFAGVVERQEVLAKADYTIYDLRQIRKLINQYSNCDNSIIC